MDLKDKATRPLRLDYGNGVIKENNDWLVRLEDAEHVATEWGMQTREFYSVQLGEKQKQIEGLERRLAEKEKYIKALHARCGEEKAAVKSLHWFGRVKSIDEKSDRVALTVETDHAGTFIVTKPIFHPDIHEVQVGDECDLKMVVDGVFLNKKEREQLEKEGFLLDAPFTRAGYENMRMHMSTSHGILTGLKVEWWSLKEES